MEESRLEYPLSWPIARERTEHTEKSRFKPKRQHLVIKALSKQLRLLGADAVVITTNIKLRVDGTPRLIKDQRPPSDTGVAVYFELFGETKVLALDRWDDLRHNIHGITKHLAAFRDIERQGVVTLEQMFVGLKALPEQGTATNFRPWQDVLEFPEGGTLEDAHRCFRRKVKVTHPDMGGTREAFQEVNKAWRSAQFQFSSRNQA